MSVRRQSDLLEDDPDDSQGEKHQGSLQKPSRRLDAIASPSCSARPKELRAAAGAGLSHPISGMEDDNRHSSGDDTNPLGLSLSLDNAGSPTWAAEKGESGSAAALALAPRDSVDDGGRGNDTETSETGKRKMVENVLEQKRKASRLSSRRSQERQRKRIEYLSQEEIRLQGINQGLGTENQSYRSAIATIQELIQLRQQQPATQQPQARPHPPPRATSSESFSSLFARPRNTAVPFRNVPQQAQLPLTWNVQSPLVPPQSPFISPSTVQVQAQQNPLLSPQLLNARGLSQNSSQTTHSQQEVAQVLSSIASVLSGATTDIANAQTSQPVSSQSEVQVMLNFLSSIVNSMGNPTTSAVGSSAHQSQTQSQLQAILALLVLLNSALNQIPAKNQRRLQQRPSQAIQALEAMQQAIFCQATGMDLASRQAMQHQQQQQLDMLSQNRAQSNPFQNPQNSQTMLAAMFPQLQTLVQGQQQQQQQSTQAQLQQPMQHPLEQQQQHHLLSSLYSAVTNQKQQSVAVPGGTLYLNLQSQPQQQRPGTIHRQSVVSGTPQPSHLLPSQDEKGGGDDHEEDNGD